ncbi:MAG: ABC transporter substrate-binding protein [Balneolaceae bacterium]
MHTKILPLLFLLLYSPLLYAQNFDEALELYKQEEYEEASKLFSNLDGDRAALFAGKSYLATGDYLIANSFLHIARQSELEGIANEALYSSALTYFRQKEYTKSLELLYKLQTKRDRTGLQIRANRLYNEILRFLTDRQRFRVFNEVDTYEIRLDLFRSSINRIQYPALRAMLLELEKLKLAHNQTDRLEELKQAMGDRDTYSVTPFQQTGVPQGMVYHIGVALPSFEDSDQDFTLPRNIFFGITLAAEEFNARNPDKKAFIRYKDTESDPAKIPDIMNELIWNDHIDAVIGPLYSESAKEMSRLSEVYEIPMIAPLANSDSINLGHKYTYQINPTFSVHGKNMARFAVRELNMDTLAVMTQKDALGQYSARAFRHEAERLGAYIAYYFEEDFAAQGYDLTDYTEVFTSDSVLVDSLGYTPVQGIYAPFTGQAAGSMTQLLMNDLEAMQSDVVVMGSEEWKNVNFTDRQHNYFAIFYSKPLGTAADSSTTEYFTQDYINRFGIEPDSFAKLGYDTGRFLLQALDRSGNPDLLSREIQDSPVYEGLSTRIHFNGTQINQLVTIQAITEKARKQLDQADFVNSQ